MTPKRNHERPHLQVVRQSARVHPKGTRIAAESLESRATSKVILVRMGSARRDTFAWSLLGVVSSHLGRRCLVVERNYRCHRGWFEGRPNRLYTVRPWLALPTSSSRVGGHLSLGNCENGRVEGSIEGGEHAALYTE